MKRINHFSPVAMVTAALLIARLLLAMADWVAALVYFNAPDLYPVIGEPLDRLYPLHFPVMLIQWVSIGVWLYLYHRDLRLRWRDYPITPGGALARAFVPVYNFWGFWNLWDTLDSYAAADSTLPRPRFTARSAAIFFYVVWIGSGMAGYFPAYREWLWANVVTRFGEITSLMWVFWVANATLKRLVRDPDLRTRTDTGMPN